MLTKRMKTLATLGGIALLGLGSAACAYDNYGDHRGGRWDRHDNRGERKPWERNDSRPDRGGSRDDRKPWERNDSRGGGRSCRSDPARRSAPCPVLERSARL